MSQRRIDEVVDVLCALAAAIAVLSGHGVGAVGVAAALLAAFGFLTLILPRKRREP